ncbi:hypothetical protein AAKU52_002473 [Pedobacter sp. CG_S7]
MVFILFDDVDGRRQQCNYRPDIGFLAVLDDPAFAINALVNIGVL